MDPIRGFFNWRVINCYRDVDAVKGLLLFFTKAYSKLKTIQHPADKVLALGVWCSPSETA